MILKEIFKDMLEALVYICAFLVIPLTVCFGLYITKNPLCLIGLMLCYKLEHNSKDENDDKNVNQKIEEE